jgi:hypothetical protein
MLRSKSFNIRRESSEQDKEKLAQDAIKQNVYQVDIYLEKEIASGDKINIFLKNITSIIAL